MTSPKLTAADRPALKPWLTTRMVGNEMVVLLPDGDQACVLNPQATAVLQLCDGTRTVQDLIADLQTRYFGHTATMSRQIEDCLLQFRNLALLQ